MIGFKATENRLRETNIDFSYLTRESNKCDYKTPLIQNLRRHLEIHNMGFKCDL